MAAPSVSNDCAGGCPGQCHNPPPLKNSYTKTRIEPPPRLVVMQFPEHCGVKLTSPEIGATSYNANRT